MSFIIVVAAAAAAAATSIAPGTPATGGLKLLYFTRQFTAICWLLYTAAAVQADAQACLPALLCPHLLDRC
jgi:hypothetical protein